MIERGNNLRTSEELKKLLKQIKNDEYRVPDGMDAFNLVMDMTEHIGHVDPELRDKLIYTTLYKWTISGTFTPEQMRQLLSICLNEQHLFYRIGEKDTDSVFTRTFSVLIIPLVFYVNRQYDFLTKSEVLNVKDKIIEYIEQEKDMRGYVDGKGWADSRAHLSDAIGDIASDKYIEHDDLIDLLVAMRKKISVGEYSCASNEDERMVTAFMCVYERSILTKDEICSWIISCGKVERIGVFPFDLYVQVNTKNFLRSLYFRLLPQKNKEFLIDVIKEALESL